MDQISPLRMTWALIVLIICALLQARGSDYATSSAQFDPSGRILKTEYARRAITEKGGPVAAICCQDGILLSAARQIRRSSMVLSHPKKVHQVDKHILVGAAGSLSQAQALANAARSICARYREIYDSPIPIEYLCSSLSDELHRLTREARGNPVGVGLVVAGWDERGPQVRCIHSGFFFRLC